MKRLSILLVLLLTVSMTTFAQATDKEKDITEAERIIDKYGGAIVNGTADFADKVGIVLTTMAEKLQKPVEDVFNIFGFYYKAKINPYHHFHCYINIPDTCDRDSLFQAEARRCRRSEEHTSELQSPM